MSVESSVEVWITCPYDKAHRVIKEEMLDHLKICRKVYIKMMAAQGRSMNMVFCSKSWNHYIPRLELGTHHLLCKAKDEDGNDIIIQEADSSSSGSLLEEVEGEASGQNDGLEDLEDEDWEAECAGASSTVGK